MQKDLTTRIVTTQKTTKKVVLTNVSKHELKSTDGSYVAVQTAQAMFDLLVMNTIVHNEKETAGSAHCDTLSPKI